MPHRYRSADEDSARWEQLVFRPGDVVVSTRSKHGTTWVQAAVLMLVHGPELPAPLGQLSPWLDFLGEELDAVLSRLAAQAHRRVIKTHSPLDGIPLTGGVHYVVMARHPLDAAVSLWHQSANISRARMAELTGREEATGTRPEATDWLRRWIAADPDPRAELDSLPGVIHHLADAWARRDDPSVILVHYDDLHADRAGQLHRLADRLAIKVPEAVWPAVVEATAFERMRARAAEFAPDPAGVLRDRVAFFRRGSSGAADDLLDAADRAAYRHRAQKLVGDAEPGFLAWLHGEKA